VPPDEVRTVPLVLAVLPVVPVVPVPPVLAPLVPLVLRWDRDAGEEDGSAAAWLA